MKIIVAKAGNVVVMAGDDLTLTSDGATGRDIVAPDFTTANAMLRQVDALPNPWAVGAYKHTLAGGFQLVDASLVPDRMAELQAALAAAATARRWEVETGGIVLPNGARINTARSDQDAITRVVANAAEAGIESFDFKAASGWLSLTLEQLRGIASAVARHVQACYGREREHHEAIAALQTVAVAEAYDIGTGWPSNTEATS
ncbi:DUF4376 domain-containing protein [uncultured Xylophilus sp.]|uniref:DUF4376 domain-containing protein n=1 Tax=uncultured Xylophilus sp. TaxID=296832 RepID=UPI002600959D|nr:DUF4376 domain-containing protein [uncultured Xylophilus sp.]